jgi:hypothetical protein
VSITPSAVLSDTWLFDGSAWLPVMTNTAPPARTQSAMAYDVRRGVSVLYGGLDALGRPLSDTWEFDGSAWTLAPTAHAPATGLSQAGGLYEHAMAYDPGAELLLLTGGTDGLYDTSLTWTFDGDDWRQLATTGAPYPRHGHALAFDSGRGAVLLFGGAHGLAYADVYAWTGDGWETVAGGAGAPPARAGHGLCFDALAGQALLFGGIGATSVLLGDAWGLDTLGWKLLTPVTRTFSASVPLVCR